jgi:hypothetical protein
MPHQWGMPFLRLLASLPFPLVPSPQDTPSWPPPMESDLGTARGMVQDRPIPRAPTLEVPHLPERRHGGGTGRAPGRP